MGFYVNKHTVEIQVVDTILLEMFHQSEEPIRTVNLNAASVCFMLVHTSLQFSCGAVTKSVVVAQSTGFAGPASSESTENPNQDLDEDGISVPKPTAIGPHVMPIVAAGPAIRPDMMPVEAAGWLDVLMRPFKRRCDFCSIYLTGFGAEASASADGENFFPRKNMALEAWEIFLD